MNPPSWIIDCDPGCDDALALALLAAPSQLPVGTPVEVLTVAGNVGVDSTTGNACRIVAACEKGKDWQVYRGCNGSLAGEAVPAASVHGRDGLGDVPNNAFGVKPLKHVANTSAVQRLVEWADGNQKFVLVCTGPLTNLATALNLIPAAQQDSFWKRCEICVVMGGAFKVPGNITASAEFNCYFDPVATHLVLESWRMADERLGKARLKPIHFVPLDVTENVGIPLHAGDATEKPPAPFLRAILRKYGQFHARFCMRPRSGEQNPVDEQVTPAFGIRRFDEDAFLEQRALGKSGLKDLGAFCYLHDPLAIWTALKYQHKNFEKWWSDAQVTVDTTQGAGRGRIILHVEKTEDGPSQIPNLGTKVRWLDPHPRKFTPRLRGEFVAEIEKLLGLPANRVRRRTTASQS